MIKEDLVAERIAIDSYGEMIRYLGNDDPTTRRMLEDILAMEEKHADDLVTLLEELKGTSAADRRAAGPPAYLMTATSSGIRAAPHRSSTSPVAISVRSGTQARPVDDRVRRASRPAA